MKYETHSTSAAFMQWLEGYQSAAPRLQQNVKDAHFLTSSRILAGLFLYLCCGVAFLALALAQSSTSEGGPNAPLNSIPGESISDASEVWLPDGDASEVWLPSGASGSGSG